ncbi:hypothetical protein MAPG_09638 [Magnaporthiopsis poae ATCC 64411]|uniref:Uncharacterized protein n=1 Tax=Magnaporthiopsis poae (strain ATCC 64411 / 73-15) TaxID=644358 RepID=A0A0C4EAG8_MAGP6|nr:hypothetical protein MAPG_09638 [Magnaporthiopsis poae ATCC 64411]
METATGAAAQLREQWLNPNDVSAVLMIIGGDVVRTALAQSTGTLFTPVCFSFGWVAYAFVALIGVVGDGRLLPPPDFSVRVFNLDSGYSRENKNWVIGRILRDHEVSIVRAVGCEAGVHIAIYEAVSRGEPGIGFWTSFPYDRLHLFGLAAMVVQFGIAAIPATLYNDWTILLVLAVGTVLALLHGALPQWRAEKLPDRQHSWGTFGLTTGNGSRDIMVVKDLGRCLNLEELAATGTPRSSLPWRKFRKVPASIQAAAASPGSSGNSNNTFFRRANTLLPVAKPVRGIPLGFWYTCAVTIFGSIAWMFLLVTVTAVRENRWYLLAVGGIGVFQNGITAAVARPPKSRNLPLKLVDIITAKKTMDGLMDLQDAHGCGWHLVGEFFPGELKAEEDAWWNGEKDAYDGKRRKEACIRGLPYGDRLKKRSQ